MVSKLLVLPVDQYLHPVVPTEHLPDLLPGALSETAAATNHCLIVLPPLVSVVCAS